ncbi:hypothetical protein C8J56DRAFT_899390 [Mycena floridula]|nr:hypothetical protein C8J56DRAFT_899390 [Mycena floridula]
MLMRKMWIWTLAFPMAGNSYYEERTVEECKVSDIKKKTSPASDNPLRKWTGWTTSDGIYRPGFRVEFLEEFICHEGHLEQPKCPQCKNPFHVVNVSKQQQLLRAEWYPTTIDHLKTAITFRMLEKFHLLNLSGKVSTYEYYKCLQHLTDNTETEIPKPRYKTLLRVLRQYRHLKLMKRAGCGNIPDGIATIGLGELALICWACPNPGVNIAPNWKEVTPKEQWYLFMVVLAMDANFRLKNLNVSNDISDPGLHTGNAYFVANKEYSDHYKKFASQKDRIQKPVTGRESRRMRLVSHWRQNVYLHSPRNGATKWCRRPASQRKSAVGHGSMAQQDPQSMLDWVHVTIHWTDMMGHHNWRKSVLLGPLLHKRLILSQRWLIVQEANHRELTEALGEQVAAQWTTELNKKGCPLKTELSVRIAKASPSTFIDIALTVEELQSVDFYTRCIVISQFTCQSYKWESKRENLVKEMKVKTVEGEIIWFPSDLEPHLRSSGCMGGVVEKEEELQEAQCWDTLERIRNLKRAKMSMVIFRNNNMTSQKSNTRARMSFTEFNLKQPRAALLALRGPGEWEIKLWELHNSDIRSPGMSEFNIGADEDDDQFDINGKKKRRKKKTEYKLSAEKKIKKIRAHDGSTTAERLGAMKIEWLKSHARIQQNTEERNTVEAEMGHVRLSLLARIDWWKKRETSWPGLDAGVASGVQAYARRQADIHERILERFTRLWQMSVDTDIEIGQHEDEEEDVEMEELANQMDCLESRY